MNQEEWLRPRATGYMSCRIGQVKTRNLDGGVVEVVEDMVEEQREVRD